MVLHLNDAVSRDDGVGLAPCNWLRTCVSYRLPQDTGFFLRTKCHGMVVYGTIDASLGESPSAPCKALTSE